MITQTVFIPIQALTLQKVFSCEIMKYLERDHLAAKMLFEAMEFT